MNILIRNATPEDAVDLIRLNRDFNADGKILQDVHQVQSSLKSNATERVLIGEVNKSIQAFASIQITRTFCYNRPTVELTELFVAKLHRRQGIATLLLQEVINICIENDGLELFLRVNKNNTDAIGLYKKAGLEQAGHLIYRKKYYE